MILKVTKTKETVGTLQVELLPIPEGGVELDVCESLRQRVGPHEVDP